MIQRIGESCSWISHIILKVSIKKSSLSRTFSHKTMTQSAIESFKEFVQIRTISLDNPDYSSVERFLFSFARESGLGFKRYDAEVSPGQFRPIFITSLLGQDSTLGSIVLNSHFDVVPVAEDKWTHDPFGAELTPEGRIYGRGTQDMKSVCVQQLYALRYLAHNVSRPLRSVHAICQPDEEVGGPSCCLFVHTPEFASLRPAFALDESCASPSTRYILHYSEKYIASARFHVEGRTGHASRFIDDTAGEKLARLLTEVYSLRACELAKVRSGIPDGECTSANLTVITGGQQVNMVPNNFTITVDIRNPGRISPEELQRMLDSWCAAAGAGARYELLSKMCLPMREALIEPGAEPQPNRFWSVLTDTLGRGEYSAEVAPGASDGRHLREMGVPVVGFSPIRRTPLLSHANDEYLSLDVFLEGLQQMQRVVEALANTP